MSSSCIVSNMNKTIAYIEDYCCVVAFSAVTAPMSEQYIILMRESSKPNGGDPLGVLEYELCFPQSETYEDLRGYERLNDREIKLHFKADHSIHLYLNAQSVTEIQSFLDFIFKVSEPAK